MVKLGNDHGFINKEYISIGTRPFGEVQSKATRAYTRSEQYHTNVEGRDSYYFLCAGRSLLGSSDWPEGWSDLKVIRSPG